MDGGLDPRGRRGRPPEALSAGVYAILIATLAAILLLALDRMDPDTRFVLPPPIAIGP